MRRLIIIALAGGFMLPAAPAHAVSSAQACHATTSTSFSATEHSYQGRPLQGQPYAVANFITTAWGSAGYPFSYGWDDTAVAQNYPNESNCIAHFSRGSSIGVVWYVDIELHLEGSGTYASDFWSTGRRCYGINAATHQLVAPPDDCGKFGDPTDLRDSLD